MSCGRWYWTGPIRSTVTICYWIGRSNFIWTVRSLLVIAYIFTIVLIVLNRGHHHLYCCLFSYYTASVVFPRWRHIYIPPFTRTRDANFSEITKMWAVNSNSWQRNNFNNNWGCTLAQTGRFHKKQRKLTRPCQRGHCSLPACSEIKDLYGFRERGAQTGPAEAGITLTGERGMGEWNWPANCDDGGSCEVQASTLSDSLNPHRSTTCKLLAAQPELCVYCGPWSTFTSIQCAVLCIR